jgi:hypothetical protein
MGLAGYPMAGIAAGYCRIQKIEEHRWSTKTVVSKPVLVGLIAVVGVGVIVAAVYGYVSSSPRLGADGDERTSPKQEENNNHIVIPEKRYSHEIWAQTSTGGGDKPVATTFTLAMCALSGIEQFSEVAGADTNNPILLKRNSPEVKVEFCATSSDREAITWDLMARDADVLHDYQPDYKGALEEGVKVSFDKDTLQMPAYTWNTTVSDNPEPPNLERFNVYISADGNTRLSDTDFEVLAIRHIDEDTVQIQSATVSVKVIDE